VRERVLITGIGGFAGRHLAERLRSAGDLELLGLGTAATTTVPCNRYFACDLTDARLTSQIVGDLRPDVVYHLAARTGGATPQRLRDVNVRGFVHLCEALRNWAVQRRQPVRLLTVGSAAELGTLGTARLPVGEDAPCGPETDYGRSKLDVTLRALREPDDGPLRISVARTFNLVGPGMGPQLALGWFAAQIAAYRRGETDALLCGNLTARRDYVDVRDAVEIYIAIARCGLPGELYNVCSGRSHAVGDLLEQLVAASGLDIPIECDDAPPRPGDIPDVYGDPTKTEFATGRRATTPIEQSLRDLLESIPLRAAA
jgi:GDP-4-dehydro-6-deoxy-D-mannose reductase